MLFLPILTIAVITVLLPWLYTSINPIDLYFPGLSNSFNYYLRGSDSQISNITSQLIDDHARSQIACDPLVQHEREKKIVSTDLLHEIDGIVSEGKSRLEQLMSAAYYRYTPAIVIKQLDRISIEIRDASAFKFYKSHDYWIDNVFLFIGLIAIIKIGICIKMYLFPRVKKPIEVTKVMALPPHQYLDFETIPLCVGKGDFEEDQILKSYQDLYQLTHDSQLLKQFEADEISISSLDETVLSPSIRNTESPNSDSYLGEAFHVKRSDTSPLPSSRSESTTPEDSFEREERELDKGLSQQNDDKNAVPTTPRSLSSDFVSLNSISPSKLLFKRQSFTILTTKPSPVRVTASNTTVGDITQETVYSEPFSSDDSTDNPLKAILK